MTGAAVRLRDVTLQFGGGRGVHDVDGEIEPGRSVALIGPSGAGKSTLLELIAGTLAPTRGHVHTLGAPLAQLSGRAYRTHRARIGLLHQSDNLTPSLAVVHNVLMGHLGRWSTARALLSRVRPRARDVAEARLALEAVELGDRLWARPDTLSGGERQRVALARLVVQRPELWLADEPTSGLDVRLRRDAMTLLLQLAADARATTVVALHDLDLLDVGFDEVWGIAEGSVRWRCRPEHLDEARVQALYGVLE